MKTLLILTAILTACLQSACTSPFAPPDPGEIAVGMHAASFAPDNSTMAERQARFYQMQGLMMARNPNFKPLYAR